MHVILTYAAEGTPQPPSFLLERPRELPNRIPYFFDMHYLTFTRAVSNATLSSEDENERDLTKPSVPHSGYLVRPATMDPGSPELGSPVST